MALREMWCTNPQCRNHVHYQLVQWTEGDSAQPMQEACRRCAAKLVTEEVRARWQDSDFTEVPA